MCLITKIPTILVAEKDITVFKLLRRKTSHLGSYYESPYHSQHRWTIGETKRRKCPLMVYRIDSHYQVTHAIHAYQKLKGAYGEFKQWEYANEYINYHIIKAIIPKGTDYIKGRDGDIASQALTPIEVVSVNKARAAFIKGYMNRW